MRFLLFITIVFFSCSKSANDEPAISNGNYQSASQVSLKRPVMYTHGRQITDSAIINPFLRRYRFDAAFSNNLVEAVSDSILLLKIHNNDSLSCWIRRYRNFRVDYWPCRKTSGNSNEFFVQSYDTVFLPLMTHVLDGCGYKEDRLCKYPSLIYYRPYLSAYAPIIIPSFPLVLEGGQLKLPLLSWALRTRNCASYVSGVTNIGRANVVDSVQLSDTLVLQEGLIDMIAY